MAGGNKRLVTTLSHDAPASTRSRYPVVASSGALRQADTVLPALTRPSALIRLVQRDVEPFRIAAESGHDACAFGKQRTQKYLGGISANEDNYEPGRANGVTGGCA